MPPAAKAESTPKRALLIGGDTGRNAVVNTVINKLLNYGIEVVAHWSMTGRASPSIDTLRPDVIIVLRDMTGNELVNAMEHQRRRMDSPPPVINTNRHWAQIQQRLEEWGVEPNPPEPGPRVRLLPDRKPAPAPEPPTRGRIEMAAPREAPKKQDNWEDEIREAIQLLHDRMKAHSVRKITIYEDGKASIERLAVVQTNMEV